MAETRLHLKMNSSENKLEKESYKSWKQSKNYKSRKVSEEEMCKKRCGDTLSSHCASPPILAECDRILPLIESSAMLLHNGTIFSTVPDDGSSVWHDRGNWVTDMPTPPDSPPPGVSDLVTGTTNRLGLRNLLLVPTSNANNSFITRKFSYIIYCLRINTNFKYPDISLKSVVEDEGVSGAIEEIVTTELEDTGLDVGADGKLYTSLIAKQKNRAIKLVKDMKSALSATFIKITGYVLFKVFQYLFLSVTITEGQLQMIEAASRRNIPMIFLPLHRSHVDYLFVTWVLFNREVPAPIVAAGENLRMPLFGWILRCLGGFFIRRRLESSKSKRDFAYRSILQAYMTQSLSKGYNLEFFIEGGRTRTGKPCLPKGGLLSVIVDAHINGSLEDALIVPIAINYDKIVDGNFIREQLGQNKVPESFWRAVLAIIKILSTGFGNSRIDFSQPFSLHEFFQSSHKYNLRSTTYTPREGAVDTYGDYSQSFDPSRCHQRSLSTPERGVNSCLPKPSGPLHQTKSNSSLFGSDLTEEYRLLVKSLAQHIVYDAEKCQAIMSTNALSWLLLFLFRDGTTLDKLEVALSALRSDLRLRGRDTGFDGTDKDVLIHSLELLGPLLVNVDGDLRKDSSSSVTITPVSSLPNVIEIYYYASALMPIYSVDAILATSLVTLADCDIWSYKDVKTESLLPYTQLISRSKRLCTILQNEFIFTPPCGSLESKIDDSFDRLVVCGLIVREGAEVSKRFVRNCFIDEDSDSSVESVETFYYLTPSSESLNTISTWTRALVPLIDTYYATILNLTSLIDSPMTDKDYVNQTQIFINDMFTKGKISYGESICADPIKNCLKLLETEKVIESHTQDSTKLIYLASPYESESALWSLAKELESYRV